MEREIIIENENFEEEAKLYKKMHLMLFAKVADAIEMLENGDEVLRAAHILKCAQLECEEVYINA